MKIYYFCGVFNSVIMEARELYELYTACGSITTDSRHCPAGSMFIALKGESFDGNRFAASALEQGCSVALVDDEEVARSYRGPGRMVLVDDCLQSYKDIAREHRRLFHRPVIGITGTNGKTTTKELIRAVLAEKYNVMATEGNFNNDVGVPKTLLRLTAEHDIAVVEMGASHPGDIKTLAETAEPTCGLITNVGKAHLLGFGSLEGVVKTKGELYDNLASRPESVIFVNDDNALLTAILPPDLATERYTRHADNDRCRVQGEVVACDPFLRLRWREGKDNEWHNIDTHLIGSYNLYNALAAITIGLHFHVPADDICHAIAAFVPANNRSQLTRTEHNALIVDAYNANPTSMEAALDNFDLMQVAPKMAIIGEMRELGATSREEHCRLVERLQRSDVDTVWLVGEAFNDIDCSFTKYRDVDDVKAALTEQRPEGYHILIKGSNGNRLYQLPELL